jgi:competence transcription factor ComK
MGLECTYTDQKQKKRKIWKDGFVSIENRKLILSDCNNKQLAITTSYNTREDDLIETATYLIFIDDMNSLESKQSCEDIRETRTTENRDLKRIEQDPRSIDGILKILED